MRTIALISLLLAGCGGSDSTLSVRLLYGRTAYPDAGCLPCDVTEPMTQSAFDSTVARCFPGCVVTSTSSASRAIDCSQSCGSLWAGAKFYPPDAGEPACAWTPPDPNHLSALCLPH